MLDRLTNNIFTGYAYLEESWFLKNWYIQITIFFGLLFRPTPYRMSTLQMSTPNTEQQKDRMREERERTVAYQQRELAEQHLEFQQNNAVMFKELINLVQAGKYIEANPSTKMIEELEN